MFLNLTPTPKIAPKSAKRPKIWLNEKQKDRAVLPKQKLKVVGSKNVFEHDLDPKNSPNGPKKITTKCQKSAKRPKIWPNEKQKDTPTGASTNPKNLILKLEVETCT